MNPSDLASPNCILIGSAVFAGLTSVTDRRTDGRTEDATPSVTTGRIYVVLRCGDGGDGSSLQANLQSESVRLFPRVGVHGA